jgi:hypothetical protein
MHPEHAEHTLETIRTLMERSQRYEHISGYSGLVAGAAVLSGCLLLGSDWLPFSPRVNFALVWAGVLTVAVCGHCALTFARARERGEPAWSRQARTVVLAVLPNFLASMAASIVMWRIDRLDFLPGIWLLLYGCGALATSFFAPRSMLALGLICFALGIVSLTIVPGHPLWTMAIGFGATHLAFGGWVVLSEWKERRAYAQLFSWEQN